MCYVLHMFYGMCEMLYRMCCVVRYVLRVTYVLWHV
jgi:hypothetical protein